MLLMDFPLNHESIAKMLREILEGNPSKINYSIRDISDIKLKERYLKEVTLLSKLFAMSIPSPDAEAIKDEVAFFQAVKARINKFTGSGVKSDFEVETAIKQIVDHALSSDGVIDIFEAAGIKSPSVSILSDEFAKPMGFTGAFAGMACQDMSGQDLPCDFKYFRYTEEV